MLSPSLRSERAEEQSSRRRFRLTVLALALCVASAGCVGGPRRLPSDPGRLRYVFSDAAPGGRTPVAVLVADFDADGADEMVRFVHGEDRSSYLDISDLTEDRCYNLLTIHTQGWGEVCGLPDVTGDGVPEMVSYEQEGGTRQGTLTVSQVTMRGPSASLRHLGAVDLAYTEPVSPGGDWITSVFLLDSFDLDGNGTRESLACLVVTGMARQPRGIWLVNWETGEVVWRSPTAGTPTGGRAAADVDDDGAPELVVGLESPGNGVTEGEWSDTLAYVAVFELDGSVRWWRKIGGYSAEVALAVGDLDGNGATEVVTAVGAHSKSDVSGFRTAVWGGADGRLLAELPLGVPVNGVAVVECAEGPRVFIGSSDGRVRRLRFDDGRLVVEEEIDCREAVEHVAAARFGPTVEGVVIVAGLTSGSVAALDERLRPLAFLPIDDAPTRPTLGAIHPARFRVGDLVVEGIHSLSVLEHRKLYLERNPLPFPVKVALAVAAALGVLAGVPRLRRGSIALMRRSLLPRASREAALDELVGALATASHGKLAATSTFRRLREQASMLTLHETAPPPAFRDRFREAVENARDIGLPLVRDILTKAARLGLVPASAARLSRELRELARITSRPVDAVPSAPEAVALRDRLDRILPAVTEELRAVKRAADRERSSPLVKGIERAIAARRDDLASAGVALREPAVSAGAGARVAATAAEIVFVVENLISNAARAVEGMPDPRISVDLRQEGDDALVTVEDSGKGIAPERQAAIFEEGVSDRAGGGHGLAESRRILAVRGGSIRIARSAPGEGTAFEVRFRIVS
jgi:signal transduction histidine kinase